jgi:hypothetical protein
MSSVNKINSAFTERLTPMVTLAAASRPVNPFASTGRQNSQTKKDEFKVRPSVSLQEDLGAIFQGSVVSTKNDDSVRLDTYSIRENPKRETVKHTTSRLDVEHTRER